MDLYFGHGEAWLASRSNAGVPLDFDVPLPEIDELTLNLERDLVEHISKRTEIASKDLKVPRMVTLSGSMRVSTHTKEVLELALYGTISAVAGGAFVATALDDAAVEVGQIVRIPGNKVHVSSLVMTDSTGSPVTLTLDTHYEIVDLDAGLIRILDLTGLTQPLKAAGTEAAGNNVGLLTNRTVEKWLRFKGINIADDDRVCVVDLYRVQFEPTSNWTLLNSGNEPNQYELNFEALVDTNVEPDAVLGRHGRYKELT